MKKSFLWIVTILVTSMLVNCSKDKEDKNTSSFDGMISGKIASAGSQFDEIKVYARVADEYRFLVSGQVNNGSFFINLPTPPDEYLIEEETPEGLTASNPAAKGVYVKIEAYRNGNKVGTIERGKGGTNVVYKSEFVYVDSGVTTTGTHTEKENGYEYAYIYNENLKKGWNIRTLTISNVGNKYTVKAQAGNEPKGMFWFILPD